MSNPEPQRRRFFPLPRLLGRAGEGARQQARDSWTGPLPSPPRQAGEGRGDPASGSIAVEWSRIVLPIVTLALGVAAWELVVRLKDIPPFILPGPGLVTATIASNWPLLWNSLLVTLATTFYGLALAFAGGVGLAILFNQSRLIEHSLYPYAVILQVTPVVAVAPLLLIYLPQEAAVLA